MKRESTHLFVVAVLALLGPLVGKGYGDFVLWDDEQLTVDSFHRYGDLYDSSRASIVSGGYVRYLDAYDSSAVDMSGGGREHLLHLRFLHRQHLRRSGQQLRRL